MTPKQLGEIPDFEPNIYDAIKDNKLSSVKYHIKHNPKIIDELDI